MPTKGELASLSSDMEALRLNFQETYHSWTDDIPVCPLSGVGFSTNQKYRMDGFRREEHEFEDRSFHFQYDENTHFYGVFDGHGGTKAADFAAQRMPAEILLGQLKGKESDQDVRDVLQQAFLAVENSFFESIDDLLAEKENLRLQLQGLRTIEAYEKFPEAVTRLKKVTEEIRTGSAAVVALVVNNKLYVANVGDGRALLCTEDKERRLTIHQLSCDHTFSNKDELLRLSQIGIKHEEMLSLKPGLNNCTRCIGNYTVKGGYKEFDFFSEADDEPVIAEPNIIGGIKLDENCKCLLLLSSGLYRALEEAGTSNANSFLVNMVLEQFSEQSTLNGVAQAVVDKVVRIHHDVFMKDNGNPKSCQKRDDITLLVRNFNCQLPHAQDTNTSVQSSDKIPLDLQRQESSENTLSDVHSISDAKSDLEQDSNIFMNDTISLSSSSESSHPQALFQVASSLSLDEDGRVKPYVDFSDFFTAAAEAYKNELIAKEWITPSS